MSKPEVTGRIMDLLKGFDKIKDTSKVRSTYIDAAGRTLKIVLQLAEASNFSSDLGLDSLDTVEVVMAIEEVR